MSSIHAAFHSLARCLPEALLCTSTSGAVREANPAAQRMLGSAGPELDLTDVAREEKHEVQRYLRMCHRSRTFLPGTLHLRRPDGSSCSLRTWGVRLETETDEAPMVLLRLEPKDKATAVFETLNLELKKLNAHRRKLNKQRMLIRKQKAAILEFTAPMIDVWDGVLLVPLFGVLSESYFDRVLANLLDRVSRKGTRWVILDMTGAPGTSVIATASIARIARALRLLGARCILAGLGPQLAQEFAAHGEFPEELSTEQNLQAALARCLREDDAKRALRYASELD